MISDKFQVMIFIILRLPISHNWKCCVVLLKIEQKGPSKVKESFVI